MSEEDKGNVSEVVDQASQLVKSQTSEEVLKPQVGFKQASEGVLRTPVNTESTLEITMTEQRTRQSVYCGPIPPASELKKYEDIVPGAAERLLKMAEREQKKYL